MENTLHEIVLTGGPCGGKTTASCHLEEKLSNRGYRVLSVPEAATRFISGGIDDIGKIAQENSGLYFEIQRNILKTHLNERKVYRSLANNFVKNGENVVILYDRGAMDSKSYMHMDYFRVLLEEESLGLDYVRDSYDAVLHMVTAAVGAEEFYTLENNEARKETAEQARELDKRTQEAWVGTPHLRIIDNSTDFKKKIFRLENAVYRVLGIPEPLEIEKKFLLTTTPEITKIDGNVEIVAIEQKYLQSNNGEERRIRKRTSGDNSSVYYLTTKKEVKPGVRIEKERKISPREYVELSKLQDSATITINKKRHCFIHDSQYFELDIFESPQEGLSLLEIELNEINDAVVIPSYLPIWKEVTGDKKFSNHQIARSL